MNMNTLTIVLTTIILLVVGGFLAYAFYASQRTRRLKNDFGSEYQSELDKEGNRQKAENELSKRAERVEALNLRELDPDERDRFIKKWQGIQREFVNNPSFEVEEAKQLITSILLARGYPMAPFDRFVENVSVNHPDIASNYRDAHAVAVKVDRMEVNTEELRLAMVNYNTVIDELLGTEAEWSEESEPEMAKI